MKINVYLNDTALTFTNTDEWTTRFDHVITCLKVLSDIPQESISLIIHTKIYLNVVVLPNKKLTDFLEKDKERKKSFISVLKRV